MSARRLLYRNRLSATLGDSGCVWVWGPAGAGKTTLVHAHFGAVGGRARTHHLDARDRDPSQLFQRVAALFASTERAVTEFPGPQFADPLVFSRRFWMEFWKAVPEHTTVILEDQHELGRAPHLASILREAIVAIPPGSGHRLIITSRDAVPEELRELLLLGQLTELDEAELRLTPDEAGALAAARLGASAAARSSTLFGLTRGWVGCHVLLLDHLHAGGELPAESGAAGPRALYDYLAREVIGGLPAEDRAALLAASLFATATVDRVAKLGECEDAGTALVRLLDRGLLARDDEDGTVTVHPLLAAACHRTGINERGVEAWEALTLRAAELLAEEGRLDEAIYAALRHGHVDRAVGWVRDAAWSVLSSGKAVTLMQWFEALPRDRVERDSRLRFWTTYTCDLSPQRGTNTQAAYRDLVSDGDWLGAYSAWTVIADELAMGMETRQSGEWLDEFERLERLAPHPPDPVLDVHFPRTLRYARVSADREPLTPSVARELIRQFAAGFANAPATSNLLWKVHYRCGIGSASALLQEVKTAFGQRKQDPLSALAISCSTMLVHLAHHEHERAAAEGAFAIALELDLGMPLLEVPIRTGLVQGAYLAGDHAAAGKHAAVLAQAPSRGTNLEEACRSFGLSADALHTRDWATARRHMTMIRDRAADAGTAELSVHALLLDASVRAAMEAPGAEEAIDQAVATARASDLVGFLPTALMFSAWLALRSGRFERARAHVCEGLQAARLGGGLIPTVERRHISESVAFALQEGIETDAARWLVQSLRLTPPGRAFRGWPGTLEVRALGGFRLLRDGELVPPPTGKGRELLTALVALGGRDVPVSALQDRLWPDAEGDAARRAFDTALHRLRQHPSMRGLLDLADGRLGLSSGRVWIDVDVIRELSSMTQLTKPAELDARADEFWATYTGDLLGDLEEYPWVVESRGQVRAFGARFARNLVDSLLRADRVPEAERAADRAVAAGLIEPTGKAHLMVRQKTVPPPPAP